MLALSSQKVGLLLIGTCSVFPFDSDSNSELQSHQAELLLGACLNKDLPGNWARTGEKQSCPWSTRVTMCVTRKEEKVEGILKDKSVMIHSISYFFSLLWQNDQQEQLKKECLWTQSLKMQLSWQGSYDSNSWGDWSHRIHREDADQKWMQMHSSLGTQIFKAMSFSIG